MSPNATTDELRRSHDVLAEVYAEHLADHLDRTPVEQHVLGLFADLVGGTGDGAAVLDAGCGTGRLLPWLSARGLRPCGVDLSGEMVRVARRDAPGHDVRVGDLRALPFADATFDGVVAWYSLMYLPPDERPAAFAELARVLRPGGHLVVAHKAGDDARRRGGEQLGLEIGFDIWWMSPDEVASQCAGAGLTTVFWAGRPAYPEDQQPQGFLLVRKDGNPA